MPGPNCAPRECSGGTKVGGEAAIYIYVHLTSWFSSALDGGS